MLIRLRSASIEQQLTSMKGVYAVHDTYLNSCVFQLLPSVFGGGQTADQREKYKLLSRCDPGELGIYIYISHQKSAAFRQLSCRAQKSRRSEKKVSKKGACIICKNWGTILCEISLHTMSVVVHVYDVTHRESVKGR